jgi:hypothetical protein
MFESKKPRKVAAHLRWKYVKVEKGAQFTAWTAGPLVGVPCHWDFACKPCRRELTGDVLACKYCLAQLRQRWIGYVPLYDQHLRQLVCGIGPDLETSVARLELHTPVRVRKGRSPVDPIIVERADWTTLGCFAQGRQSEPQDLRPWLLQLWDDPELTAFLSRGIDPGATDLPPEPIKDEDLPKAREQGKKELEKSAAILKNRLKGWQRDSESGQTTPTASVNPSKNGKH